MRSLTNQQLNRQLQQITQGIDQAIDWISDARQHAIRLDIEADLLTIKLRRHHHQARQLSDSALTAMSIGFFGHSAAGKQHLISALVADGNGRLETTFGGKTLDFWQQIKPGYQASGVVTRFSHQVAITHDSHPVLLSLLSEVDIARLVAGASLLEHQDEQRHSLDEQHIADHLQQLTMRRQPVAIAGISRDDVVGLWDYLARHDARRQKILNSHFWPTAIELAPYLSIDDRARLFSVLWAERPPLTEAYRHFAYTLQHLGGAAQVLAPLSVLVDDMLLPANGIMNVATLDYLNTPADTHIQVLPWVNNQAGNLVTLSLAELTLLAVELQIPLPMPATENVFASVDLLDFPDFNHALNAAIPLDHHVYPQAALLSQAKNSYLLERYTDQQQINLLLVCNAATQRAEVKAVGKALDYWVKQTQGENAQVRSRRNPGLIWALTPFDQRITSDQSVAGATNYDEAVQRYVGNPGDSWGTLLALDTRGVERMVTYLAQEIRRDIKTERINEQLIELKRELTDNLLADWTQSAASESQQKQRIAETLLKTLQTRTGLHGELLERLLPCRDELRALYLQQPDSRQPQNRTAELSLGAVNAEPFSIGIDIDLFSDLPLSPEVERSMTPTAGYDYETEYAASVQRYWINHLRQLPDNGPLIELLGISKPTLELLVAELITASIRLDIAGQLVTILADSEQVGLHREAKADRQVSRALTILGDFVAWLGFLQISEAQRPDSRINRGAKIFAQPPKSAAPLGPSQRLTKLARTPTNNTAFYIYDWLVGLGEIIIQNEGYSASSEITAQHREQLAAIFMLFNAD
ncbi:virulence factor SrfC family protein [Yersinia sp. Marseille-Q3913]|uniref:putative virulence factor n=1 Tax=Yersinia sp. Marseille-Q3913 TaxID=2830769 RepID=UPI001BAFE1D4|nr:virulence factor SrfC family protein [Yersinia sp. Marseille-Q3913]MBS0055860.1 virulence factor [Yersinia sp. Marseille-Q3913]